MGKVNVVLPSGKVVSMDEDEARIATAPVSGRPSRMQLENPIEEGVRDAAERRHERYGGVGGALASAGSGLVDTATLGGFGKLAGALGLGEQYRDTAQENPGYRKLGEAGAFLLPGVGEASGIGGAARAGELAAAKSGSKALGRLTEGAILGAGAHVAQSNVTGDPLTIEGVLEGSTIGGVLNVGLGVAADKMMASSNRAKEAVQASEAAHADTLLADEGRPVLENDSEAGYQYKVVKDAHARAQRTAATAVRDAQNAADEYASFARSDLLGKDGAAARAQKVVSGIRNRYAAGDPLAGEAAAAPAAAAPEMPFDVSDSPAPAPPATAAPQVPPPTYVEGQPRAEMTGYDAEGNPSRILVPSKPPISEDMASRLKDFQSRISRVYQKAGGNWDLDSAGRWKFAPGTPANPEGALEDLRGIHADLRGEGGRRGFPKAAGDLAELPMKPGPVPEFTPVRLPGTLNEFARQKPDTIARLANQLDPATSGEVGKLAQALDIAPAATPGETVAAVHAKLSNYRRAIDAVAEAAKKKADEPTSLFWKALGFGGRLAARVAGFKAGGGGVLGYFLGKDLGSLADEAMMAAREALQKKAVDVVAKYGPTGARGLSGLGPVTASLGVQFPSGAPDPEKDSRKRALNRMAEFRAAVKYAPDASFYALQPLMGHPGDVAYKTHQKILATVAHLVQKSPKDPGTDSTMAGSEFLPSWKDTIALAHRLEAMQDPAKHVARTLQGDGHPAGAETLGVAWPAFVQAVAQEMAFSRLDRVSPTAAAGYGQLVGAPATGLQQPQIVSAIQGQYMAPSPSAPSSAAPHGKPSGPNGRPPAVQSQLAGSSVSGLISQ